MFLVTWHTLTSCADFLDLILRCPYKLFHQIFSTFVSIYSETTVGSGFWAAERDWSLEGMLQHG